MENCVVLTTIPARLRIGRGSYLELEFLSTRWELTSARLDTSARIGRYAEGFTLSAKPIDDLPQAPLTPFAVFAS